MTTLGRGKQMESAEPATVSAGAGETTTPSRNQSAAGLESLGKILQNALEKKGPGVFTVPGLLKLKRISKPATKARKGINPFTKQEMTFKAKPARNVVKALPLKSLKEMV